MYPLSNKTEQIVLNGCTLQLFLVRKLVLTQGFYHWQRLNSDKGFLSGALEKLDSNSTKHSFLSPRIPDETCSSVISTGLKTGSDSFKVC